MRSFAHKVHISIGGRKDGRTDIRKDVKPKTMSISFSSKRREDKKGQMVISLMTRARPFRTKTRPCKIQRFFSAEEEEKKEEEEEEEKENCIGFFKKIFSIITYIVDTR